MSPHWFLFHRWNAEHILPQMLPILDLNLSVSLPLLFPSISQVVNTHTGYCMKTHTAAVFSPSPTNENREQTLTNHVKQIDLKKSTKREHEIFPLQSLRPQSVTDLLFISPASDLIKCNHLLEFPSQYPCLH